MSIGICPRDGQRLILARNGKNRFFYCSLCRGMAFNQTQVRDLFTAQQLKLLDDIFLQNLSSKLKCPFCSNNMHIGCREYNTFHLEIDRCHRCSGLWLDHGEVRKIQEINRLEIVQQQSLIELARQSQIKSEVFARQNPSFVEAPGDEVSIFSQFGLLTEESSQQVSKTPFMTIVLLLICAWASFQGFQNINFLKNLAFDSELPLRSKIISSLSSFFVHANLPHLLGNMYLFWMLGDNVEDDLGHWQYLLLLALGTMMGCLTLDMFNAEPVIAVGASGGISTLIAYYALRFPNNRLVLPLGGWVYRRYFRIKAELLFIIYLLFQFAMGSLQNSNQINSKIGYWAHIGGAMAGVFWYVFRVNGSQSFVSKKN